MSIKNKESIATFGTDKARDDRIRQLLSSEFENRVATGEIIRPTIVANTSKLKNADSFAIIACTPTFFKTGNRLEETGVHYHIYKNGEVVQDFTATEIRLDGFTITELMATNFAFQRDLKANRNLDVGYLICDSCHTPIISSGEKAFDNSNQHECQNCGTNHFSDQSCISNPIIQIFNQYV